MARSLLLRVGAGVLTFSLLGSASWADRPADGATASPRDAARSDEVGAVERDGECAPGWTPGVFPTSPGPNGGITAMVEFDDGSGPALYVSGSFTRVGDVDTTSIARWDGYEWSAVGQGALGSTYAMVVHDDGSGPALFAATTVDLGGGVFTGGMSKWDGTSWSGVGGGVNGPNGGVIALAVYDDGLGGGPALYAGGGFLTAGGIPAICMAKWNGTTWSAVGSGVAGGAGGAFTQVQSLCVFDDGSGPALFAGGLFATAGGVPAEGIAKWNGVAWSAVGSGLANLGNYPNVNSMVVFDDGSGAGESLFLAGAFTSAGGVQVNNIARWNGSAWSRPGPLSGLSGYATELLVFDDGKGQGPQLYVAGSFSFAGGVAASRIAKWNGVSFIPLTTGVNEVVQALAPFTLNGVTQLFVGGSFTGAGVKAANRIARWDGDQWESLESGINAAVYALATFDDGTGGGEALYAGGDFTTAGSVLAANVARWDGSTWTRLGTGLNGTVHALAVYDGGNGPRLHAAGAFRADSGGPAWRVAWWSGLNWVAVGDGTNNTAYALTVFDDTLLGQGPGLYMGGNFTFPSARVSRWNGSTWTALGSGLTGGSVRALAYYEHGVRDQLFAGGFFTATGTTPRNRIARWSGVSWADVGGGMNDAVRALAVFDDGSTPVGKLLFAGGAFTMAGEASANRVAKWDGTAWAPVGSGMDAPVYALTVFDDGSGGGSALFAAGAFTTADGAPAQSLAKWDGAAWSAVGGGLNATAWALAPFDDAQGAARELYVGGEFSRAGGLVSGHIARWEGCALAPPPACLGDTNDDGLIDFDDITMVIANWLNFYGAGTGPGDADGDGSVNFRDINEVLAHWGAACGE